MILGIIALIVIVLAVFGPLIGGAALIYKGSDSLDIDDVLLATD